MIVFLDTSPLGAITNPTPSSQEVHQIKAWAEQLGNAGHLLIVPAVADYEQRREHLLRGATKSLDLLDAFIAAAPNRYLHLNDSALKLAAQLWANVRKMGMPTADQRELDCDILIAAQVLDLALPAGSFIVATGNTRHLSRLIACDVWQNINP